MDSREITVWLDKRWYDALSKHLDSGTVEDRLSSCLKELIGQLPQEVQDQISREIQEEDLRQQQEIEAAKKYSAFHVREHGQEEYFQLERSLNIVDAAHLLREYLRKDRQDSFPDFCGIRQRITAGEFDQLAGVHMENPKKVTGAFALDFDKKEFSSVDAEDGWRTYPMRDVSTAVYHACRAEGLSSRQRLARFTERLADSEMESAGHLSARQVSFAEEISEIDSRLNFYMETNFDVDAMFGTHVCTEENNDCLNVYAEYDMEAGRVCDELEVDLHWADGREESIPYTLNAAEKAILLRKMDQYCQEQTGMTLKDYSAQLLAEDEQPYRDREPRAIRSISVFRVTQNGRTEHLLTEGDGAMETLHTALRLQEYLVAKDSSSTRVAQVIPAADTIAPEVFRECAEEMRQDTGKVIAALDIDLDRDMLSTMAGPNGWQTYTINNILMAAWEATRPDHMEWNGRRCIFADQLEDKLIDQEPTGIAPPAGPVM